MYGCTALVGANALFMGAQLPLAPVYFEPWLKAKVNSYIFNFLIKILSELASPISIGCVFHSFGA